MAKTQDETSTVGQAKEKAGQVKDKAQQTVQGTVQQGAEQVRGQAQQVRGQVGQRVREQVDTRSTQAGSQLHSTADALRRTGDQLRMDGKEQPAKVTEAVAERAERLGNYMTDADADRILGDAENFARQRPWVVALGGGLLGFLASRFLKASSGENGQRRQQGDRWSRGYESGEYGSGYGSTTTPDMMDVPPTSPGLAGGPATPQVGGPEHSGTSPVGH